jgi:hypothetical protein
MSYSIWLLTATCLAGQAPDARPMYWPQPQGNVQVVEYTESSGEGRGLFHLFSRRRQVTYTPCNAGCGCGNTNPCGCNSAAPQISQSREPGLAPTMQAEQTQTAETPGQFQLKKEFAQRVAMADDASWLIGQLYYIHADGGLWVVRYAPLDKEDRYGGGVVLARGVNMDEFHEGDLVFIRGEIVNQGRACKYVGGPLYRVTTVALTERVDQPGAVGAGGAQ